MYKALCLYILVRFQHERMRAAQESELNFIAGGVALNCPVAIVFCVGNFTLQILRLMHIKNE